MLNDPIIIVGGGCFGLSTALSLSDTHSNITVIDKLSIPTIDAASTDINKIIRADYGLDSLYQSLALNSIKKWSHWNSLSHKKLFYQSGVFMSTIADTFGTYESNSYHSLSSIGLSLYKNHSIPLLRFPGLNHLRSRLPFGYFNPLGGWAHSEHAIEFLYNTLRHKGVHFKTGKEGHVKQLVRENSQVVGVETMDSTIHRGLIILATGAWTTSIFPEMKDMIKPIGQPVIHLQVPPSLQDMFATENCPVWAADLANLGFYGFPLVKGENIVKIAHHGNGYTYQQNNNYMPKTVISDPTTGSRIPLKAVHTFRTFLNGHFPHLAQLDITHTRMCWYTDSWDGHFYITRVPGHPNLIVATGGSGHGFKFMPVIGDIVVDVINGVDTEATRRFQWRQPMGETKEECRGHFGNPDCLNTVILATDADLKSNALCHL